MIHRKKKGFTIMELVIVMTLTVVVLGIIWAMFNINNKIISDVTIKSDLQREGQAIQEKLSNIGMQAIGIESVKGEESTGKMENITIKSYDKNENKCSFEIKNIDSEIFVDGKELSNNVESIKIDSEIIKEDGDEVALSKNSYIDFTIMLSKKKTYNNERINYPIKVRTVFRNKNN